MNSENDNRKKWNSQFSPFMHLSIYSIKVLNGDGKLKFISVGGYVFDIRSMAV